jgi:hypothetical protein
MIEDIVGKDKELDFHNKKMQHKRRLKSLKEKNKKHTSTNKSLDAITK